MKTYIQNIIVLILLVITNISHAQKLDKNVLTFEEFLGYVKKYHPIVKQAHLQLTESEANLLKARGGFDPKIDIDYNHKKFKETNYYTTFNTTFKIPTWYGIELKGNFEENTGSFLNPNLTVPKDGLYSAGVSFSLARGFLINDRIAALKKAKNFLEQTKAQRDILINMILFEASKAYLEWVKTYTEQEIYASFLLNAKTRFQGVKYSIKAGDKAAIDSTEAKITFQNRQLRLEEARLLKQKTALNASNYLWINEIPLELEETTIPILPSIKEIKKSLQLKETTQGKSWLKKHPKIRSLQAKLNNLKVDRTLKRNKLLPKIKLDYNFLTTAVDQFENFNTNNYKTRITFSLPLFLRKERGDLKLTHVKLQNAHLDLLMTSLSLRNKIDASYIEINSLAEQYQIITNLTNNYRALVIAEERKFNLGESSLFLINSREQKLIEATLKENSVKIKHLKSHLNLYNALGISKNEISYQ